LHAVRQEAERILGNKSKRSITDMNKFFENNYGTKKFEKVHERAFAKKLGEDVIARRTEIQRRILKLKEDVQNLGRVELDGDEVKVILGSEEHLHFNRYLNSQELLDMDWCFIDIEKPRFNTPKEEVSWVAITYTHNGIMRKEIHTSKKTGEDFKEKFDLEAGCEVLDHYENENQLMAGVQASINEANPGVVCAYNTPYDFIELRETEHGFEIGPRRARPKKEVTLRFFERIDLKDKIVIDPLHWAKIAKKFLPNRKLAMIAPELGLDFKKSISYQIMAELEDIIDGMPWQKASTETKIKIKEFAGTISEIPNLGEVCAQLIAHYVGSDVTVLPEMISSPEFQRYLKHLDAICEFADVNLQKAAHTASAINNLQKKAFFERTGTHIDVIHRVTDVAKRASERIKRFIKAKKKKAVRKKTKELGLRKNIAQFVIPTWQIVREDMEHKFPDAKKFFDYIEEHRDVPEDYYMLSQYADKFCEYLMEAWGKYIKARDEFNRDVDKAAINYYKLDDACKLCRDLLRDTSEENRVKKPYVPLATLETILSSRAYMKEYRGEMPKDKTEAVTEKHIRDAKRKDIRKVTRLLKGQKLDAQTFGEWFNEWLKVEKKRAQVIMPFDTDPERVEILQFEQQMINFNAALKDAGAKVVHKKNEHVFTTVDGVEELPADIPAIKVGEHEKVYITKDPSASGNKVYFQKHGYYGGIRIQDEPSNILTLFEMKAYGGFLDKLFEGRIDDAVVHLERERERFRDNMISNEELVFFVKSSQRYKAFVGGEEIQFYIQDDRPKTYDKQKGMYFVWEFNEKKDRFEQVYVSSIENLALDRDKYSERIEDRIAKLLEPISEMTADEEHWPVKLQEIYPKVPGGFEKYSDLSQKPIDVARTAIEQGDVLDWRGLAIFRTYKAYRSGFRADFEHPDIRQAKALWAWNMIQSSLLHPANARRKQFVVESSSREGEFHIVTKQNQSVSPYSCTCEWSQFRNRRYCSHIKKVMNEN